MSQWAVIRNSRRKVWPAGLLLTLSMFSMVASVLAIVYFWVDPPDATDAGQITVSGRLIDLFGAKWALLGGTAILILVALLLFLFVAFQTRKMRNWWGAPLSAAPVHPIWRIHSSPAADLAAEIACSIGSVSFIAAAAWVWSERPSANDIGRHTFSARLVEIFGPDRARFVGVALFVVLALLMAVATAMFESRLSHPGSRARIDPPA
ncbi:MAG TPA: hypothetical protein VN851_23660 [Thermoanaerobaculia bacterium]|nr:hypothetical protein [Thermoanaerobaculia bacterium]